MANWMETSSSVRASNSYESTSHARWRTQSNGSRADRTHKTEKNKPKDTRQKLEESLWSVLGEFNAPILKTREKTKKVMKLVERYCRFRSHVSNSSSGMKATSTPKSTSKSSSATKSFSSSKSPSVASPTKSASKPKHATKLLASSKSPDRTPTYKIPKMATTNGSPAAGKSKSCPSPSKTKYNHEDKFVAELKNELQRLADSEGFVTTYPSRYKRVPKPVDRFTVTVHDKNRARRCARRSTSRRQSNQTDVIEATPKKKEKPAEDERIFEVQQQKTISETTSTIG